MMHLRILLKELINSASLENEIPLMETDNPKIIIDTYILKAKFIQKLTLILSKIQRSRYPLVSNKCLENKKHNITDYVKEKGLHPLRVYLHRSN